MNILGAAVSWNTEYHSALKAMLVIHATMWIDLKTGMLSEIGHVQ